MGIYINLKDCSKEQWLIDNGEMPKMSPDTHERTTKAGVDQFAVCWINNGWMTAAAICYNQSELEVFKHPDPRPKQWFWVDKEKLKEFM